jgi:DNA-binding transcriptional MocR family regulator
MGKLPDIQMLLRPGVVEFGWGHPDFRLMPAEALGQASATALAQGREMLAYGAAQGPGRLIEPLCARLGLLDPPAPEPAQILITAGISQALELICDLQTRPGDVVLVEAPVYHFALRLLRDHDLELVPVTADADGLRVDALEDALAGLRHVGRQAKLLYTVPTYNNPSGSTLAPQRRARILELAGEYEIMILEDDVYRELWFDAPPPRSLWSMRSAVEVVRLGSFSKILAPGLRLGWLCASAEFVRRTTMRGLLNSGGGIGHFTACMVAEYLGTGALDEQVGRLREHYRAQRDALHTALVRHLPDGCRWSLPRGGFFLWLELPAGLDSRVLLPGAETAGVGYIPGPSFWAGGGGERYLRLAFSLLPPEEMELGAERLGRVIRQAAAS